MKATAVPSPASLRSDVIRLSQSEFPAPAPLRLARVESLDPAAADAAPEQERHVGAWRASLGHAYLEGAAQVTDGR